MKFIKYPGKGASILFDFFWKKISSEDSCPGSINDHHHFIKNDMMIFNRLNL